MNVELSSGVVPAEVDAIVSTFSNETVELFLRNTLYCKRKSLSLKDALTGNYPNGCYFRLRNHLFIKSGGSWKVDPRPHSSEAPKTPPTWGRFKTASVFH